MANAARTNAPNATIDAEVRITKTTRRLAGAGTWVFGTVAGYRFVVLVFPEHAACPEYELGKSRISKLWVQRIADKKMVVNFDRGWDLRPANPTTAKLVDLLAADLADRVYHA